MYVPFPSADSVQLADATSAIVTSPLTVTPLSNEALGVLTVKLPNILVPEFPFRTEVPSPLWANFTSPVKVYAVVTVVPSSPLPLLPPPPGAMPLNFS